MAPDEQNLRTLLSEWLDRVVKKQRIHHQEAVRNSKYNLLLGVPVICLTTVTGTSIFASLGQETSTGSKIVFGSLSILAAILAGLQTFLQFSDKAARHLEMSSTFSTLRRDIEYLLADPKLTEKELQKQVADLRERLRVAYEGSPLHYEPAEIF